MPAALRRSCSAAWRCIRASWSAGTSPGTMTGLGDAALALGEIEEARVHFQHALAAAAESHVSPLVTETQMRLAQLP